MNDISSDELTDDVDVCNCFRTFDRVARKIVYTTWAEIWETWTACDALGFASGIMARSAGISTFCPCGVIYYSSQLSSKTGIFNFFLQITHSCSKYFLNMSNAFFLVTTKSPYGLASWIFLYVLLSPSPKC